MLRAVTASLSDPELIGPAPSGGEQQETFPRAARITRAVDFKRVLDSACRIKSGCLTFVALPNELGRARLGLAIPKRHVPRAVARNRVKRRLRESFRRHRNSLPSLDVVVLGRPGLNTQNNAQLCASIERAWRVLTERFATS